MAVRKSIRRRGGTKKRQHVGHRLSGVRAVIVEVLEQPDIRAKPLPPGNRSCAEIGVAVSRRRIARIGTSRLVASRGVIMARITC